MPRVKYAFFSIIVTAILFYTSPVFADVVPGYSGMVRVSENEFLMVNDRKNPIQPGYRLGILSLTEEDGVLFTPITVRDWMHEGKEPSDLEACCKIPGRDNEFLLAESGYFNGRFGRIFHVSLSVNKEKGWNVSAIKAFRIYTRKLNAKDRTYKGDQVEGMACFSAFGKTILAYGERGGKTHAGNKVGTIVWGTLDFSTYQFDKLGEAPLVNQSLLGDRDCSALLLELNKDGSISVLSVATRDEGDNGPFHSVLYRAGRFIVDSKKKTVEFEREARPITISNLSGLKVEAIDGPAKNAPDSKYSVGTDDEHFGGIWRPLFGERK